MVQTSDVSDITINPNYTVPIDGNDIAILKLTTPFTFTTAVKAITIPTQGCTVGLVIYVVFSAAQDRHVHLELT